MRTFTDAELTAIYNSANNILEGKSPPITTRHIFTAMQAMVDQEPTPFPTSGNRFEQLAARAGFVVRGTEIVTTEGAFTGTATKSLQKFAVLLLADCAAWGEINGGLVPSDLQYLTDELFGTPTQGDDK